MLYPILIMTLIGLISGVFLAIATKFFHIEKDERIDVIKDLLPNVNCGACGYTGCVALANAIVKDGVSAETCPVASMQAINDISKVMNVSISDSSKKIAVIMCNGGKNATDKYEYHGVKDCYSMSLLLGGIKDCAYGCLGGGSCVDVCPFNAITMGDKGIPIVDSEICTGCGICVEECPKNIINLFNKGEFATVKCASKDKGPDTKKFCVVGCIGCKICEKVCPEKIIVVNNYLAKIDESKCSLCGECVKNCPVSAIEIIKL